MKGVMKTRVVFPDGTDQLGAYNAVYWRPSLALTDAIGCAEISKGMPHAGAWLEFVSDPPPWPGA